MMIPESIQQEADALKLDGVETIYIVIPQKQQEFNIAAKEMRLREMLHDLGFNHIISRRKITLEFSKILPIRTDIECFYQLMNPVDAVVIADEWTGDIECRIEVLLALRAGKIMLNENLVKAERFNTVNLKFQYDAK